TAAMQYARDQFLARPALAHDQDTARNRRNPRDGVPERPHRSAVADERRVAIEARAERAQLGHQLPARDGVLDLLHDALDRLGLVDESIRAQPHRLDAAVVAAGAGIDDDR